MVKAKELEGDSEIANHKLKPNRLLFIHDEDKVAEVGGAKMAPAAAKALTDVEIGDNYGKERSDNTRESGNSHFW